MLVGAHTCSFVALRQLFPSVQVLTLSDPQGSSAIMNDKRQRFDIAATPISAPASTGPRWLWPQGRPAPATSARTASAGPRPCWLLSKASCAAGQTSS